MTTTKPIPDDLREWAREIKGVSDFLRKLSKRPPDVRTAWEKSQEAYWKDRLEALIMNPPALPGKMTWRKMLEVWNSRTA